MKTPTEEKPQFLITSDATEIWRKSLTLSAIASIIFFTNIFSFEAQATTVGLHIYFSFFSSVFCLGSLLAVGANKKWVSEVTYIYVAVVGLALVAINNHHLASIGETAKIFEGYKVAAILFAFLAHKNWKVGGGLILACGLMPVIQFISWPQAWRTEVYGGPFVPVIYATVAMGTYIYIIRSRAKLECLIKTEMEAIDLRRFAKVMISAKDLSNTPLQILKADLALIRLQPRNLEESLSRMEMACKKLEQLNSIFGKYEYALDWSDSEAMSSEDTINRETELLTKKWTE